MGGKYKVSDDLLGGQQQQAEPRKTAGRKYSVSEDLLSGRTVEPFIPTPEPVGPFGRRDIDNPEFREGGPLPGVAAFREAGWVDDPEIKRVIFARRLFPDLPEDEALKKVQVRGNDIAWLGDDNKWRKVSSVSGRQFLGELTGPRAPEAILGGLGTMVGGPGLGMLTAGAGAVAGEGVRKAVGGAVYGQEPDAGRDLIDYGVAFGAGAAGEGVSRGLGVLAQEGMRVATAPGDIGRIAAQDVRRRAVASPAAAGALEAKAATAGIDLTPGEIYNSPSLLTYYKTLRKTPGPGADRLAQFEENVRKPQVEAAVNKYVESIAPAMPSIEDGATKGIKAADDYLESLEKAREAKAGPLYERAFQSSGPVDLRKSAKVLDYWIYEAGQNTPAAKELGRIKGMFYESGKQVPQAKPRPGFRRPTQPPAKPEDVLKTDARVVHSLKEELDTFFDKNPLMSKDKRLNRAIQQTKHQLLAAMDSASDGEYAAARKTFEAMSKPIDAFKKTALGKIAGLEGADVFLATNKIFGPKRARPQLIARARAEMMSIDPEAWNQLLRAHLDDVLVSQNDTVRGAQAAMKWRNVVFGSELKKQNMRAAMTGPQYQALSDMVDVLDAAARVVDFNSDTAFKAAAQEDIKRAAGGIASKFMRFASSRLSPGKAAEYMEAMRFPEFSDRVAQAIIDPKGQASIRKLRQMKPGTEQWMRQIITVLSTGTAGVYAGDVTK